MDENLNHTASGKSSETQVTCSSHCCSELLTSSSLNMEMMQKLVEIKTKWKHLCENITALNENNNFDEIDFENLFQSIGLNLDSPKIETKSEPPKTQVPGEVVKSIEEVMNLGLNTKSVENQQTYAQVFLKYKKNKNMITGIQIPLHRVMSTIFDPKKLQIQNMKKWLDVDNNSKRFVCGMEGVMSIVHAFSIKNELFTLKTGVKNKTSDYGPYDGLADIIWQAGDGSSAIVVQYEPQFTHTRLFECLDAKKCFNINEVCFQLASVYATPQPPISLILSVILTRGLDRVQADLSYSKTKTLLTQDGDETWSLILLLLIGQAVGHVMHSQFPKNWNPVRSPIGILSLDEYGEKVYVSPFFKTPRFPLWLIHYCHDGNHYSLLFGHCKQLLSDWKEEKNFMLHHWDFDSEEMKTVQIRTTGRITQDPDEVKDVLEMIVRTKWPIANIDIKSGVGNAMAASPDQFPSLKRRLFSRYSEKTKLYSC
uniref:Ubiquitin carboxyl-terminal hydrolase MINDY n=1 Tax=Cacopsylla melanoneura TaxID=428564 RepID=A0A8D8YZK8_9HEMI